MHRLKILDEFEYLDLKVRDDVTWHFRLRWEAVE